MTPNVVPLPARNKPLVDLGCRVTGKPEYFRDSVTGEYSEQLPLICGDDLMLQRALRPPKVVSEWAPAVELCKRFLTRVTRWN